jgi:flagellar biosynthesis protein FlhG
LRRLFDQAASLRNRWWGGEGTDANVPWMRSSGPRATVNGERPAESEGGAAALSGLIDGPPATAIEQTSLLAVASGKGGVGKTFLAVNLSLALRDLGRRCLLVDLDWGLANVDVALGVAPKHNIGHVLSGECSLEEALIDHHGLTILPNGCGQANLAHLDRVQRADLVAAVRTVRMDRDLVIADTHPGIGSLNVDVLREAKMTVIIATPEPTALTDTYALFKVLSKTEMRGPAGLIINQTSSAEQAIEVARHLDAVSRRFLGHGIDYWGYVMSDVAVPRSVRQQRPLLDLAPRSVAARAIREIAGRIVKSV